MECRADDPRIAKMQSDLTHLHVCVESVKTALRENTEVTEQIRDILRSFRILMVIAKWIAAIGAAAAAIKEWWPKA
jgi:hypothetical protein